MAKVIIYTNQNGNVAVTVPTGELPIEQVLAKDCPQNAIIIDDSELPQGDDAKYFNAWVLNNGVVTVDATKKATMQSAKQTEITAKESALSKLTALGLTADEVKALLGVA
jgi:hypothetical protein